MFALETPRWGFCKSGALHMLSHGQFRILLRLDLDGVPGVRLLSGIQAGKSVEDQPLHDVSAVPACGAAQPCAAQAMLQH